MNTATVTPPPTAAELATALLASDNILRDIRLSHQDGHLTERAAYHMEHIARVTDANHLLFCNRCRQARATAADLDAIDRNPPAYPENQPSEIRNQKSINPPAAAFPHSFAGHYELTGTADTMAGIAQILTAMGAVIQQPPGTRLTAIRLERAAIIAAHGTGCRLRQRLIASGFLAFLTETERLPDIALSIHRLGLAITLLNTALGNSNA